MTALKHIDNVPAPPARPAEAHKGTFGTVIVIGGSSTMIGAPAIAGSAALRGGAGLVKLATWPMLLPHCLTIEPGATGLTLANEAGALTALLDEADPKQRAVLAVGPGLGGSAEAASLVDQALAGPRPVVLDADGLNHLAASGGQHPSTGPPLVLTPHPGEFARLAEPMGVTDSPTDPDQRPAAAATLAAAHHAVVALKGSATVVADARRRFINATGNPAMATAGSGDVLTGLTASLLAQGMAPFDAAALAVHAHGLAGDRWAADHGPAGLLARELTGMLPATLNQLRQSA